ncbi:MAG: diguanylate cyclase [Zoogloeaceae bacterium]|jgi:diguanylate cyclase (GGDEF)-like protein|nr:diguanylate cyclase [Zoogloeaceae bacterium]
MRLNTKISLFFITMSVGLMAVLVAISLYAFREFSIRNATEHIRTAAELTRLHLTSAMISGIIDQRRQFLSRLTEVHGLTTAYVIRSPVVNEQFGESDLGEPTPDALEKQVMQTATPAFEIIDEGDRLLFRGTIPYVATAKGSPNCLQCHAAKEGEVLGAVTMVMSIAGMRTQAIWTVAGIAGSIALFVIFVLFLLRRMVAPIGQTAHAVEDLVHSALEGHFRGHVEKRTNDEIGQIASEFNRLVDYLHSGLSRISGLVSQLTGRKPKSGENLLDATIDMVEGLTQASIFKQAIEEDEAKVEIYQRLSVVLEDSFKLPHFSIYEVAHASNDMSTIIVDGVLAAPCRWCDPKIMEHSESCRARRTGHLVDGVAQPGICYAFAPPAGDGAPSEELGHMCFPIIQSGVVGSIVQIVVKREDQERITAALPYISAYLREAAPVLEARRLTETLKESTLRDPMTGLNNRRFLEEYVETLIANVRRKSSHLSVLMLDLDHFKMVNDTLGHDAGDAVLKSLSHIMRQSVRASDMVIRYGGEEFLIVLQDTHGADADQVAENIRAAVEKMRVNINGGTIQKTISIGIADFPDDCDTFWQAVKFADVALYQSKEKGRNRVTRFTADMWSNKQEY